ncbi:unnamed protein product, partial [Notodromas monacha]
MTSMFDNSDDEWDAPPAAKKANVDAEEPLSLSSPSSTGVTLTNEQKKRIEANRQKALMIQRERESRAKKEQWKAEKAAKVAKQVENDKRKAAILSHAERIVQYNDTKLIDSGSGFFVSEGDLIECESKEKRVVLTEKKAPILAHDGQPDCDECGKGFSASYLFEHFDEPVCDACRDKDEKHALITKTDARNEFLLKDCDLDLREPLLRFLTRPNPHNQRWGQMKLYLRLQVEKRALEVWGSEEALEEEHERRGGNKERTKQKRMEKKV